MNYKLSKLVIGLAAVCAFSGQANADTSFGFVSPNSLLPVFDFTSTPFTDNYSFTIPASVDATISETSGGSFFGISGLSASLYKSTGFNSFVSSGSALETSSNTLGSSGSASFLAPITLAAGNYDLRITGTPIGIGGYYTGAVTVTAAPVPEPTEGALLLSGLGLLGFIAARRKNV